MVKKVLKEILLFFLFFVLLVLLSLSVSGFLGKNVGVVESNHSTVLLKDLITDSDIKKIRTKKENIFANMSLVGESIPVPQIANLSKLKKMMNKFLESAHETTKKRLAEMRKAEK